MSRFAGMLACALVVSFAAHPAASAAETPATGCSAFTWDVSRELSLMTADATATNAATSAKTPARIELDRHYLAHLSPQKDVELPAKPGKPMLDDGANAGLLTFRVPKDGLYRVAINSGHWIDVVDAGVVVPSRDFQGQRGCMAIHKVVEFDLHAGRDLVLQFSGGTDADVGIAITAAPPGK